MSINLFLAWLSNGLILVVCGLIIALVFMMIEYFRFRG